ncbi:MAG TPA: rhodanese-like domain-containing protein [Terracidiphilus sp.]
MRWKHGCRWMLLLTLFLAMVAVAVVLAQESAGASSSAASIPESRLIQPEALAQLLKGGEKEKPVILQVGSRVMFAQAHIPGSDYAGPGSQASGIQSLENTVASLPKDRQLVLYCGCCPWSRCPNVGPAYKRLHDLGFTNVKVLYIANNFGDDWVNKGYPAVKGK